MKLLSVLMAFLVPVSAFAMGQTSPPPAPAVNLPSSLTETECEGTQCATGKSEGTWVFHGSLADAQWDNGAEAKLVVQRFDAGESTYAASTCPTALPMA
jgi:hypothetical protein